MNKKLVLGARASRTRGEAVATATRIVKSNKHGNIVRLNKDELEIGNDLLPVYIFVLELGYYYHRGPDLRKK